MKILSEKEQLRERIINVDDSILYLQREVNNINKKIRRKNNWGIFSFNFEPYWFLYYIHKEKGTQLVLMEEYRDILIGRLNK